MIGALLLALLPVAEPLRETVDLVELNHVYDTEGKSTFSQVIWYAWRGDHYEVIDWRLAKGGGILPVRDYRHGGYLSRWHDGEVFREVRAKNYRETPTQYDIEVFEREILPKERRRGLRRP